MHTTFKFLGNRVIQTNPLYLTKGYILRYIFVQITFETRGRERERETDTDTDTDTWFIVKATDPYTSMGWGRGERILHFSTIFDDLMDDAHCSAYFLPFHIV